MGETSCALVTFLNFQPHLQWDARNRSIFRFWDVMLFRQACGGLWCRIVNAVGADIFHSSPHSQVYFQPASTILASCGCWPARTTSASSTAVQCAVMLATWGPQKDFRGRENAEVRGITALVSVLRRWLRLWPSTPDSAALKVAPSPGFQINMYLTFTTASPLVPCSLVLGMSNSVSYSLRCLGIHFVGL